MEKKTTTVEVEKIRLDSFLSGVFDISRSLVKNILEKDGALVNGVLKNKSGFELKSGDIVEFTVPDAVELDLAPANIPLDIVFQDEYFCVINKPQGMVVHPATSYREGDTLVNALLFNLDNLSAINGVIRPGIVHRLDKNTSGLIVVAKNDMAHKSLASQIEKKTARRIYVGIVDGNIKEDEGDVDQPIGRNKRDRKKMAVVDDGRNASTHYKVLERFSAYTYAQFELKTGRTHQIRVHMKFLHHPIVGDEVYGGSQILAKNAQFLHATRLILRHPATNEEMTFDAPIPPKFQNTLDKLRKTTLK
ncbi:MAG: RluA family pseudouridine synthase [Clostridia bacterium]|nr:RluA family pseudouridine synthase [Clostridia bacterium]